MPDPNFSANRQRNIPGQRRRGNSRRAAETLEKCDHVKRNWQQFHPTEMNNRETCQFPGNNSARQFHSSEGGRQNPNSESVCRQSSSDVFSLLQSGTVAISVTLLVTFMTFAIRAYYVTLETSWWILHPDEIYQSLEVAHSEIYGYGVRTYEFLAPARGDNLSLHQQRELQLGMHALRSPLYPAFYVAVSWLLQLTGYSSDPYLVWRTAHVTISSMLPLAAHFFTSALFRSHDLGALAAILVASSVHLNVLGTHILVHSFMAPALFVSLAGLWSLLQVDVDSTVIGQSTKSLSQSDANSGAINSISDPESSKKQSAQEVSWSRSDPRRSVTHNICSRKGHSEQDGLNDQNSLHDKQSRVEAPKSTLVIFYACALCDRVGKLLARYTNAASTVLSGRSSDRTLDQFFFTKSTKPKLTGAVWRTSVRSVTACPRSQRTAAQPNQSDSFWRDCKLLVCSFTLSLICYIRPDSVLIVTAVVTPYILLPFTRLVVIVKQENFARDVFFCVLGVLAGIAIGVFEDFRFYGVGVVSPVNWFKFNVLSSSVTQFFGASSARFYVEFILLKNSGMTLLLAINIAGFAVSGYQTFGEISHCEKRRKIEWFYMKGRLLVGILVLFGIYSFQQHKEVRFVHHVIVLYIVLSASNIWSVARAVNQIFEKPVTMTSCRLLTTLIICSFFFSQWCDFPLIGQESAKSWMYRDDSENYDVTKCLKFIASQDDVRGVFADKNLYGVGGYTLLRHNVPILALTFQGYLEYGLSSRLEVQPKMWPHSASNISLLILNKVSNYFLPQNHQSLLRHLIKQKEYNYLIMARKTNFLNAGYRSIFHSGSMKVVKRLGTKEDEQNLKDMVPFLRLEPDIELLEEVRQLHAFGLKELAALRFSEARKKK